MKVIEEREKVLVRLADGREFELEIWPFNSKMVAFTLAYENKAGIGCMLDMGVNLETEEVVGPDLPKD